LPREINPQLHSCNLVTSELVLSVHLNMRFGSFFFSCWLPGSGFYRLSWADINRLRALRLVCGVSTAGTRL